MNCRACRTPARLLFAKDGIPCHLCPACGSLSKPAPTDLESHYAEYLPQATLSLPPVTRERYQAILEGLDGFGEKWARRLLDVGAGAGLFLDVAMEEGWAAEGTELSARAAAAADLRGLVVHVGDLADLDLSEGSFDAGHKEAERDGGPDHEHRGHDEEDHAREPQENACCPSRRLGFCHGSSPSTGIPA